MRGVAAEFAGAGFQPNEAVTVVAMTSEGAAVELGTVTADAQGGFQSNIVLPEGMAAGEYTVQAIGQRGSQSVAGGTVRLR